MEKVHKSLFFIALALIVYMPLHVFISQSASLLTGGLEAWKAAKDVFIAVLVPILLYVGYKQGLHKSKYTQILAGLSVIYGLLHLGFVLFDQDDDTYSAIAGSVFNIRILVYLLLGIVVGSLPQAKTYMKHLLTAAVLIASAVSVFGVAQYFLPPDLLENVGYSLERGVKPLFFIDDRADLPRVMSTLKDPNSYGAYLIIPILLTGWTLMKKSDRAKLFSIHIAGSVLAVMLFVQLTAFVMTFSRGAFLGLVLSFVALLFLTQGHQMLQLLKKYWLILLATVIALIGLLFVFRDSVLVQDYVFHAAVSSNDLDPNAKRVSLQQEAVEDIFDMPLGYGPGSAGLIAISNPQGGILTENYYLQIAYEVGLLGVSIFVAILFTVCLCLYKASNKQPIAVFMLASFVGYAFYSLLIHLWSNEAVALQWWLLCGVVLGVSIKTPGYDRPNIPKAHK